MAGSPQQPQNTDNSLAMLWGVLLALSVIGLAWFCFHETITAWILSVRLVEARFIAFFVPSMQSRRQYLESLVPYHLRLSDLVMISSDIGRYLRFPISLILGSFAVATYLSRATLRFNRDYSMQQLAALEQQNWSQIAPVISLDLVHTPIDRGPWAMALTPLEFSKQHDLVSFSKPTASNSGVVTMIIDRHLQTTLKREAAQRVFTLQLGSLWQGAHSLSVPAKSLFAIFAARGVRNSQLADELLKEVTQVATYYLHQPAQLMHTKLASSTTINAVVERYEYHPLVRQVTNQHAYVLGVMASMLILARRDGVLASADFLWLKAYDRPLWFMLNCIGRQTAYTEVAGPFAHWRVECAVGRKLKVPMVNMAVEALDQALKEVRLPETDDK